MVMPKTTGWFALDSMDLTGVGSATFMLGWQTPPQYGFDFEAHLDAPDGKLLGTVSLMPQPKAFTYTSPGSGGKQQFAMVTLKLQPVNDDGFHSIYFISKPRDNRETAQAGIGFVRFNGK